MKNTYAGHTYDDYKRMFENYGITDAQWEVIEQAKEKSETGVLPFLYEIMQNPAILERCMVFVERIAS